MNRASSLPKVISTGCPELDLVWERFAGAILDRPGVLIPDTDEDLTWHAFLGHSIDMQGFRAAEFAGVDNLTRPSSEFRSLRQRQVGAAELASLWDIPAIKRHLLTQTKGQPFTSTLEILSERGGELGQSLSDAFQHFPWRKFHWSVRALLENSAVLANHGFSFRRWLQNECLVIGASQFPPADFRAAVRVRGEVTTIERALRTRIERAFYRVGPALAAYMICDWQLWLWNEGHTAVFETFKPDSFHDTFVGKYGLGIVPAGEEAFARWWLDAYPELPPRLANECIWLGIENKVI